MAKYRDGSEAKINDTVKFVDSLNNEVVGTLTEIKENTEMSVGTITYVVMGPSISNNTLVDIKDMDLIHRA